MVHDGSGYPRTEFASGETVAVDVEFETSDPRLAFHVRVGVDREDGVQAFAVDSRSEPWSPLTGRGRYRLRLSFPRLPVAQGDFRVYVYLGDEKALHVHDVRILKPGFSVASLGLHGGSPAAGARVGLPRARRRRARGRSGRGPFRGPALSRAVAFLSAPHPLDYGGRLSRLRWKRAARAERVVDWDLGSLAARGAGRRRLVGRGAG